MLLCEHPWEAMKMQDREIEQAEMAAETEIGCDIDGDTAREEALWYAIMNVIALCLGSGMGISCEPEKPDELLDWTGIGWSNLPLSAPKPLKALFKSGDPHLLREFEQGNLDSWRWAADSFDRSLVPQAQGWPIIAEIECAKWFGIPQSAKVMPEDIGNSWKANGMLLWAMARKQLDFAFNNLRDNKGLFVTAVETGSLKVADPGNDLADQAVMLWACSDAASLAGRSDSIYADDNSRRCFMDFADELFRAIADNKNELLRSSVDVVKAQSIAILALVWYASATEAQDLKTRCFWLLRELADNLVKAQDANEMVGNNLVDAASALRALTEAFRITHLRTYAEAASRIFSFIESQWSVPDGVYAQTPLSREFTYNADDIGIILGALNSSRLFLGDRVDRELADLRMRVFFCRAVNISGLQMSMPSATFLPEWFQAREPSAHFRYGSIPLPSEADGEFGTAPVLAAEVGYDPQTQTWSRRMLFDVPAAMHACCELLWMNSEAICGFPDVKLEHSPASVQQAARLSQAE